MSSDLDIEADISDENTFELMGPEDVRIGPPFCDLFPIRPAIFDQVADSMRHDGFHRSKPLEIWKEANLLIDGHTRLKAALETGQCDIPVCFLSFPDEDAALKYAIANQRDRRNMTDAELLRCIEIVDQRHKQGNHRGNQYTREKNISREEQTGLESASNDAISKSSDRSAKKTADIVGTSRAKVERARSVLISEDEELKQSVLGGDKSIYKASKEARKKSKRKSRDRSRQDYIPDSSRAKSQANGHVATSPIAKELVLSEEDEHWLSSFPLRARVVSWKFDRDAIAYRRFETRLGEIKDELHELFGYANPAHMTSLRLVLHRATSVRPVQEWFLCPKCGGEGCKKCRMGGYLIVGI